MEVVFIIVFAALFVIFFVLWMTDRSRNDSLTVDSKPIRDIRETLDQSLERITAIEDKLSVVPDGSGPLSIDDVRNALLANDIAPETIDTSESGRIWFTIDNTRFSIELSRSPFFCFELVFRMKVEEEDVELMEQAARIVTLGMYIAKVDVNPEKKYFICQADMIADTYLYLTNNFKRYINLLIDASHRFNEEYDKLRKERIKAAEDALKNTMMATAQGLDSKSIHS